MDNEFFAGGSVNYQSYNNLRSLLDSLYEFKEVFSIPIKIKKTSDVIVYDFGIKGKIKLESDICFVHITEDLNPEIKRKIEEIAGVTF